MIIHVTQKHIDNGKRASWSLCPIALAVSEQTDRGCVIGFGYCAFPSMLPSLHQSYKLPSEAITFYQEFDAGYDAYPFDFELDFSQEKALIVESERELVPA